VHGGRVLLLGDYTAAGTEALLQAVEAALPHVPPGMTFAIKPHPSCPVPAERIAALGLTLVTAPLGELLPEFDVACSANGTSAAVDAYAVGTPLVVLLEREALNMSPLRGRADVAFAATPHELARELARQSASPARSASPMDYSCVDPEYPRWRRLLAPSAERRTTLTNATASPLS
jgi:surface carbohydrate biosynthesis protein (TIGR04326 family)